MQSRNPAAGGIAIAVLALVGAFYGASVGEASAGLLIGLGAGGLIALVVWAIDRRR